MRTRRLSFLCCLLFSLLMLSLAGCGPNPAREAKIPEIQKERPLPSPSVIPTQQPEDYPVRLLIPAIHVDAPIESVGVLQSGDLDTPRQQPWTDAGWYSASPDPGSAGSSVIDGHLDRPGGFPAVFWDLHLLSAGDEISVIHHSGKSTVFVITSTASYALQDVPLQAIFGTGGGHYLNLITCAGDWIPSQHQTTSRMVVYSSRTT
jgi:sortase (surface protein transpeptidase)